MKVFIGYNFLAMNAWLNLYIFVHITVVTAGSQAVRLEEAIGALPESTNPERHLQHQAAVSADPDPQNPRRDPPGDPPPGGRGRQRRTQL